MLDAHKHRGLKSLLNIFLLFGAIASSAQSSTTDRPSVSVVGVGQVEVPADLADVSLVFRIEGMDSAEAMDEVNRRVNNLLTQISEHGIKEGDVIAGSIRINPRYDYQNRRARFMGYTVERPLTLTVKNLQLLPKVLNTAVAAKLSTINGVHYRASNHQALIKQAREAAIANSKAKAESLTAGYAAQLGPIFSVVYRGGETHIKSGMQAEAMMSSRAMSDRPQGRYLPDKIIVTDRVEVVFELLP